MTEVNDDPGDLGVAGQAPLSDMLKRHGDLTAAYQSTHAKHSNVIDSSQQGAAGVGLNAGDGSSLSTSAYNGSDTPGDTPGGKGIAGQLPLVRRGGGADDQTDTGQSGGRSIA
jgi:hypothetical protein